MLELFGCLNTLEVLVEELVKIVLLFSLQDGFLPANDQTHSHIENGVLVLPLDEVVIYQVYQ